MTTFVQDKTRMFRERPDWLKPERRRSESRLKTYPSSTDVRNWCDVVEDRRRHILELIVKGFDKCAGKLIPLDALIELLMAMANADIAKLKNCLKQLWSFVHGLDLKPDDLEKLKQISATMDSICKPAEVADEDADGDKCVATDRHLRERAEIEDLVADTLTERPTIQARMRGPGKMVTRIKGLQPGFQIVDDPERPNWITIKPSARRLDNGLARIASPQPQNDKLAATEALCKEQQDKIAALTKERDDLKVKLDACLRELENFKKLQTVANPVLPPSCQQEIEALEAEITIMRSGNPSPEEEAEIIKKQVQILKRYCVKLRDVESENQQLKIELGQSRVAIPDDDVMKDKLRNLEKLQSEKDALATKVAQLETRLAQYENVPEDVEVLRNRSLMLDNVMEERDGLSNKCKAMKAMEEEMKKLKARAERADELEREMKTLSRGDRSSGLELKKTRSIASNLEVELQNVRCERDAMRKRIENMKKDMDSQKGKVMEAEMLRLERDRLQIKLNELADVQAQYEEMMNKMKIFDNLKAERDAYKQKYEEVMDLECKCDRLKAQVDEARSIGRERDHLQKQVQDLEACICEQEDEIKSLVLQVDGLSKTKNDTNNRFKEEIARKDRILAASHEQLAQTQQLQARVKELEKLLHNAEHTILQKDCHIKCLENQAGGFKPSKPATREMDLVESMRRELEKAKAENRRLQEIANRMTSMGGDDHVKKMLKQSECAVKRVVQELGKQYTEWDRSHPKLPKGKFASKRECMCLEEISSGDDCEKLRLELEELQKEKRKLETTVKQLQGEGKKCPSSCLNEKI